MGCCAIFGFFTIFLIVQNYGFAKMTDLYDTSHVVPWSWSLSPSNAHFSVGAYPRLYVCARLYSFLMTSDLSLGGGVWELAVERLSHGQSPLRIQRPPPPIHTPHNTPQGALAIPSLVFSSTSPRDHSPRPPTTCIVYPDRASSPPLATASLARARARLHQHLVYGKSRVVHVCSS